MIKSGPAKIDYNWLETQIREALARGYCSPENERKVLDPVLIEAMTRELLQSFTPKTDRVEPLESSKGNIKHAHELKRVKCVSMATISGEHEAKCEFAFYNDCINTSCSHHGRHRFKEEVCEASICINFVNPEEPKPRCKRMIMVDSEWK